MEREMNPLRQQLIVLCVVCSGLLGGRAAALECDGVDTFAGQAIALQEVGRFSRPVDVTTPPGDKERLFVVEQGGRIRIVSLPGDSLVVDPFINLAGRITRNGNEQGLLGLAFHPNYSENGFFYVNYNARNGWTVVSRFQVSDDPNVADPGSELVLLTFSQPFSNHNGGQVAFGPNDGYLYISTGDGGSGGDPGNRAQNPNTFLGKLLRIDVDSPTGNLNYGIPDSNPFVGMDRVREEIWALGLRNPWRMAFDQETGDLWIGDVGQGAWEEIDFQPASSVGGENYEWRRREGRVEFSRSTSLTLGTATPPVLQYGHGAGFLRGCSVTGGQVYRGCRMPDLHGAYFFADYCNNWVGTGRLNTEGASPALADVTDRTRELNEGISGTIRQVSGFGTDALGEVYICDLSGRVYRIVPANDPPNVVIGTEPDPAVITLQGGSVQLTLDGSQSDDGKGSTEGLTYLWSRVRGPREGYTIAQPEQAVTLVTFTVEGAYRFRLTVGDEFATASALVNVTVEPEPPTFHRADSNGDGRVDLADGIFTLNFLFLGGRRPSCSDAADADDGGGIELTDAVFTFSFLFLGGGTPPEPGPDVCGTDPTDDEIDCQGGSLGCNECRIERVALDPALVITQGAFAKPPRHRGFASAASPQ
ncbi:MAG: PQQ-dependent sugar dehydrogenase [Planctomycetota bacterium]|nr:PQQ-dependent sugar dehydrogenase [Planctomycetota bacterium]